MSLGSEPRRVTRLMGAVMLGVGTLFQPKIRPDDHWSTSPRVQAQVDEKSEEAGGPEPSGPYGSRIVPRTL